MNFTKGYKAIESWNIDDITSMTEEDAFILARCRIEYKGHHIYFIDFNGTFGYSKVVFYNGAHLYYLNDYQLHHAYMKKSELFKMYKSSITTSIFDDSDFSEPVKNYDDYQYKARYLHNHYAMRIPHISAFQIIHNEQEEQAYKKKVDGLTYDPIGFCYVSDPDFVKKHIQLFDALEEQNEKRKNDFEYNKAAFLHEMFNHEYGINWQADYDVINCFDSVEYMESAGVSDYLNKTSFTDTQKAAYMEARREYFKTAVNL